MNKVNIQWTAKALVNQMEKGRVNFDNAIQRGLVWDNEKKSLLIHSMIYGYAIPAMYFTRDGESVYDSLDGKQRSNTIYEFLKNKFQLSADTPPVYDDDGNKEDISGLSFSSLPEWAQDRVKDYSFTIYYYEGMTEEEVKEFFRRLNNGKPLSSVELTRVNTPCLAKFQELAKHEAIQTITTDAAKKRFTDENIAMQIYNIFTEAEPDFSTKVFREWARGTEVNGTAFNSIKGGLDLLSSFIQSLNQQEDKTVLRAIKTRTHFVSAAYFFALCVENGTDTSDSIFHILKHFFSGKPSISDEYNKTIGAGSAKPLAVQTRKNVIKNMVDGIPQNVPF